MGSPPLIRSLKKNVISAIYSEHVYPPTFPSYQLLTKRNKYNHFLIFPGETPFPLPTSTWTVKCAVTAARNGHWVFLSKGCFKSFVCWNVITTTGWRCSKNENTFLGVQRGLFIFKGTIELGILNETYLYHNWS